MKWNPGNDLCRHILKELPRENKQREIPDEKSASFAEAVAKSMEIAYCFYLN